MCSHIQTIAPLQYGFSQVKKKQKKKTTLNLVVSNKTITKFTIK